MIIKTEVVLFKLKKTDSNSPTDFLQRLSPTDFVKYLKIEIDKNITWCYQIYNVAAKLNIPNAMLYKIRHFVNFYSSYELSELLLQFFMQFLNLS